MGLDGNLRLDGAHGANESTKNPLHGRIYLKFVSPHKMNVLNTFSVEDLTIFSLIFNFVI